MVQESERKAMLSAHEWLAEKQQKQHPIPTRNQYFTWPGIGTVGQDPEGNLLFQDDDGLWIAIHKDLTKTYQKDILQQIVSVYSGNYTTGDTTLFWSEYVAQPELISTSAIALEVSTMHKRKGVKIELVDSSGQEP
jgi:hypothetical protein